MSFCIVDSPIDPSELRNISKAAESGGFVSFEGWVRNHHDKRPVDSLEYSAYTELAEKEGNRIIAQAFETFEITSAHCHHRIGHLAIGDIAIVIAVSAHHRDAAFKAARFLIDEIKSRVPIWKKEHYSDGTTAWPHCQGCSNPEHKH